MQRTVSTAGELSVRGRRPKCSLCSCQAAPPVPPDSVQPGRRRPNTLCTALCPGVRLLPVASWTSRSRVDMCAKPRRTTGPPPSMWISCHNSKVYCITMSLSPCTPARPCGSSFLLLAACFRYLSQVARRSGGGAPGNAQNFKRERERRRGAARRTGAPTAALSERTPEPARLLRQARPGRPPASKA